MSNQVQITGDLKVRNLNGLLKATNGVVTSTAAEFISVKDFGAVGDGTTDDTAAIQAGVTFLSTTGGTLFFPVGTYKVTSEITQTYSSAVNFKMIGYGAIIDASTSSGTNLFTLQGQQSTSSLLSASPNKMDTSISTTTSIGANANDFIMLQSTDLWCPARSYYYKGELCQVISVSGTTYNLGSQLFDGYTASTTTAYKLIMPTIEIEGMEFVRNGNLIGINIQYATNVSILNCKIHGARYTALQLFYCYGGLIQNNEIYDCFYIGTGLSYGVSIASCQFVKVANNTLSEARHCITTGGTIPSRSHIYIGNSCLMHPSELQNWAIDTHGNTEFITIEGNYSNGVVISGRSAIIIGNTFIGVPPNPSSSAVGTIVIGPEGDIDNIEIRNNSITSDYSFTYSSGIVFTAAKSNGFFDNILISDNKIKVSKSAIHFILVNNTYTNNIINNLEISNNHCETNISYCFFISGLGTIGYIINKLTSNNNYYYSNYSSAVINNYNEVKIAYFTNDRFYSGANGIANTSFSGLDEAIFTNCRWEGNVTGLGNAGDVYINGIGKILNYLPITNNISRINVGTNVIDYLEQGRTGNVLSSQITSNTRYINGYSIFGYAFAYGTSTPTTGTWNQYDEIYNTNNAIGNPLKWVCDTAGTPGTWRAIYTIETYPTYNRLPQNTLVNGELAVGNTSFTDGVIIKVGGNLTGSTTSIGFYQKSIVQNDVVAADSFRSELQTAASSFTLNEFIHYLAYQNIIGTGSSVTTQIGFAALSNMIGATNNKGFSGAIPSGANNWNLYMNGSASNYINGTTLIGSTSDSGLAKLQVTGSIQQSSITSSLLKTNSNGVLIAAVDGTDYVSPSGLSSYVPYTGATSDVNIGSYNFYSNAFFNGFTSIAASGTQIVLTISSTPSYLITGSGGQTIKLPNATTLPNGTIYYFNNNQSSGAISVNNNSNTLVKSVPSGGYLVLTLIDNTSAAGGWDAHFQAPSNVSWSTNTFDYSGSITSATWNGVSIAVNRGGTGQSTYTDGQILIGNSTGNTLSKSTLSAGTGISITNGSGTITIASSLTNPVTGTGGGTTNAIPKFTGVNAIDNSNISDSGTLITLASSTYVSSGSIGIGTAAGTTQSLRISKTITGGTTAYGIFNTGTVQSDVTSTVYNNISQINTLASSFTLSTFYHYGATQGTIGSGSVVTSQMGFFATGLTGATNNYGFYGNLASASGTWNLYMSGDADNFMLGRLGIGASAAASANVSLRLRKTITGSVNSYGMLNDGIVQNDVTTSAFYFSTSTQTLASAFTLGNLYHYNATQSTIGSGSTITTQYGFAANSSMIGATNNYGFYGNIPVSGTSNWNMFMSGTAPNYMAGQVSIGTTTLVATAALNVSSTTQGFLPPRMTTTQKNAISSPATGLIVFDSTLGKLCVYGGSAWQTITSV